MLKRLALLAVVAVAAACTPGASPADLETGPLSTPTAPVESSQPSTDLPTESPAESPEESPEASPSESPAAS